MTRQPDMTTADSTGYETRDRGRHDGPNGPAALHGLAGVVAAAIGAAVGQLWASRTDPLTGPVALVSAVVVDLVPSGLKEWAVASFGTADKAVLVGGVVLGVGVLGFLCGFAGARRASYGVAGVVALGACALVAGFVRGFAPGGLLPSAVALLVGVAAYVGTRRLLTSTRTQPHATRAGGAAALDDRGGLTGRTPAPTHGAPRVEPLISRRAFALGGLGAAAAAGVVIVVSGSTEPPTPVSIPAPREPLGPLPPGLDVPGISGLQTPPSNFYRIDIALAAPRLDPRDFRLTIDGMVDAPYSLSWDDLLAQPMIDRDITLTCVSNEVGGDLCGSGRWTGVAVAPLLRRARPRSGADQVLSAAVDGFTASTPLEVLLDGRDAMIAVALDGAPLTREHGAPARLLTPGLYGYVGATKWLRTLTVTTFAEREAYWTSRGWSARGPVKTASRIDTPRGGAEVAAGRVVLGGVAWATHRGVRAVEVSVDGGPWQAAGLGADVGVDYWRQWRLPVELPPGRHTARVRATDGTGDVQTDRVAPVLPDGATGWHEVAFACR